MRETDRAELSRWADRFGWQAAAGQRYCMLKRGTHHIVVGLDPVPPGGALAYRITSPEQPSPDYVKTMSELYAWLAEPKPVSPYDRFAQPNLPVPPAPPAEPAPPIARSVARFREMEF